MSVLFSAFWSVFPLAPVKCSVTGVCHVYRGACLSQVEGTRAHQHGLAGTHARSVCLSVLGRDQDC